MFDLWGGSGESFGGSLGVFWGLGGVLGGSWGVFGRHGLFWLILKPTGPAEPRHLGAQRGAKMRQKSDPRRTKIDDKNEVEKRSS